MVLKMRHPWTLLFLLTVTILSLQFIFCDARKEKRHDGIRSISLDQNRHVTAHHSNAAEHHHSQPEREEVFAGHSPSSVVPKKGPRTGKSERSHRIKTRSKGPGVQHHASRSPEHHKTSIKHRTAVPKRNLELQKPPKPFLQPPLLPTHRTPIKHRPKQDKEKHH